MGTTVNVPTEYHYDGFPPIHLNYTDFLESLLSATAAIARYDQVLKSMHNSEILLAPLRNQEAVISSRMEGTVSTMDEIMEYEADYEDTLENDANVRSEVIETWLYQRALKTAQGMIQDGYPLSAHLIKDMHARLLSFGRGAGKSPGKFKVEQNFIADSGRRDILFVPVSPEKLQEGIDKLFDYIHQSSAPILVKTAVTHVEFEALHPFKDGNGRIGRMLITLMLWHFGSISQPHFYISGYLEDHRDEYIGLMRNVSQNNDWEVWCEFFLRAVEQQAIRNLEVAEQIRTLYEDMKGVFSETLSSKWSVNALDFMFTNPVFRNNRFASNSGIKLSTASRFTRALVEAGLLRVVYGASGRRAALYSFEPLMNLVRV